MRSGNARNLVTEVNGEIQFHRHIWRVAVRQPAHAQSNRTGSFYDDLVAMVFAFATLEEYLKLRRESPSAETMGR